jgi:hypothetical protein
MSADHEYIVYHLIASSPPAWVAGEVGTLPPNNRLLSFQLEIYQGSPFGRESRHWTPIWSQPDLTEEQVKELIAKYPLPNASSHLSDDLLDRLRI